MRVVTLIVAFALISSPVHCEEICFPIAVGTRILQDIESLAVCRDAVDASTDAVNSCEARSSALENRIVEQEKEISEREKTIEDAGKAIKEAAKASSVPWYQRILNAGKWVALGIVIGFVGGMSK